MSEQLERLTLANIIYTEAEGKLYEEANDCLGIYHTDMEVPIGYKKCGKCQQVMKLYLFNKNKATKTYSTGNCKCCQKQSSNKSYQKTKHKRTYKKYYEANKDKKRAVAREYYKANQERLNEVHKKYLASNKGKKVMKKAHTKRKNLLVKNAGVPWKRTWVIDSDIMEGDTLPTCYLCGKIIENIDGDSLHIDHVVSVNNGGLDCFTNVACTHKLCNLTKEKDDRYLSVETVQNLYNRRTAYIDAHDELFGDKDE